MSLEKLTIRYEPIQNDKFGRQIEALFNPSQLSIGSSVSWEQEASAGDSKVAESRQLRFASLPPSTLSVELFFDTYEGDPQARSRLASAARPSSPLGLATSTRPAATSVLKYTEGMAALARPARELHRPPICTLSWGTWQIFEGVLSSVDSQFSLFMEDGTPVRATVTCSFTEYLRAAPRSRTEQNSPDVAKRYTVRPGDTLVNIAATHYNDPSAWRLLADANGLGNPRKLPPGLVLALPPLPTGEE